MQDTPVLSSAEWRSIATALRDADAAAGAGNPVLDTVRRFTALTWRHRRPAEQCRRELVQAGFNDRQIDALALLSV